MAETLRIEIPVETVDKTEPELSNLTKKLEKLEKTADKAGQSAKKAGEKVTAFDRSAEKTQKSLAEWAKEKYEIVLEAKERITPVLSAVGTRIRGFAGRTWNVTMKAVDLVTAPVRGILNILKNPVFQAGAVLGISIGLADTVDTYKSFEAAMSQVQAISGATTSEMIRLNSKAKEMGATTKFTATESAEAFNYMSMAGWKTEDMLAGIEGIMNLAAASNEDLATTSDIVTDALTAFNMSAADSGHFADVLAAAASNANTDVAMMGETFKYVGAMAGALNYSIEDVSLATGLMANAGIKGTMSGTSLNAILTRLSTNTSGARDALEELGIEYFTASGSARDLSDVLDELRSATAGYSEEQKSNLANTIAGTDAQKGLLAILNASAEDYKKLSDAVNNADGAAEHMAETMLDNLQGSLTLLQSAVDGAKISLGERLAPYIGEFAGWITDQMPYVEEALDDMMDWVESKADRLKRKFGEITGTEEWQNADFFGKVRIAWDEIIATPFKEWWDSTGRQLVSEKAGEIGNAIGSGISAGLLFLLGIDVPDTVNEGASIGRAFSEGFAEGFDFEKISGKLWEGLGNMVKSAGKLLPGGESADLSSLISAALLIKGGAPVIGAGINAAKFGKTLFGSAESGGLGLGSAVKKMIGSFSIDGELAGTGMASGSGMLGMFGNAGMALGSGATSSAGLAAAGGAAITGGLVAGATLVSGGLDLYHALKSDNADESAAYGESAAWKMSGVAAGAAAGAALGSVIPGLGTAVGALIGAGVGGIAGWIKGNKVKEEYQENVEEMQREAEQAQQVFDITGLAIEDIKFANEDLQAAIHDTELSAEEKAAYIREDMARVAGEAFGDIKLSLKEIKSLAEDITFGGMKQGMEEFATAASGADSALSALKSSMSAMKKENWRAALGMQMDEADQDSYKQAIDNFVESAQQYIEDSHYEATVAMNLLTGGGADTSGMDTYYNGLKMQVDEISAQLADQVEIALEDGVITLDESKEIENLQNQVSEITNKLVNAENDASMQALGIKYSGAALDAESFAALQEELKANTELMTENYYEALTVTIKDLNLQLADGAITQEEYDEQLAAAKENYRLNIDGMNTRVQSFNLETIAEAWDSELDGILPEIEGSTADKLSRAMHNALTANSDVSAWTQEDVRKWFGLENVETSAFENIYAEIVQTAAMVPPGTKEEIIRSFQDSIPTVEEIMEGMDWTRLSWKDYDLLTGGDGAFLSDGGVSAYDSVLTGSEKNYDTISRNLAENIHNSLMESGDPEELQEFISTYMSGADNTVRDAGSAYGDLMTDGFTESMEENTGEIRTAAETAVSDAFADPFSVSADIRVTPGFTGLDQYTIPGYYGTGNGRQAGKGSGNTGSGIDKYILPWAGSMKIAGNAGGNYVSGGPQLSWLAEEGYGEYVIPTAPWRRKRALDLYAQAGQALGVGAYADGGIAGVPYSAGAAEMEGNTGNADGTVPYGGNEATGDDAPGTPSVQVSIQMNPEFHIQGEQSSEEIMQVIRRHLTELADDLGGEIAVRLREVYSNMPRRAQGWT